jgi:hypothetical protein
LIGIQVDAAESIRRAIVLIVFTPYLDEWNGPIHLNRVNPVNPKEAVPGPLSCHFHQGFDFQNDLMSLSIPSNCPSRVYIKDVIAIGRYPFLALSSCTNFFQDFS